MSKICLDSRKKPRRRKHRFGWLREKLRKWLGINSTDMKLHDTRVILFSVQDQVSGTWEKQLRNRARISKLK